MSSDIDIDKIISLPEIFEELKGLAGKHHWPGIRFSKFEMESYDSDKYEIFINFRDQYSRKYELMISSNVWFSYNKYNPSCCCLSFLFDELDFYHQNVPKYVQVFNERLFYSLLPNVIDGFLFGLEYGMEIKIYRKFVFEIVDKIFFDIITYIKPKQWINLNRPEWKVSGVHNYLCRLLPMLKKEASMGRWEFAYSDNVMIETDSRQSHIVLKYLQEDFFEIKFSLGFCIDEFDDYMYGDWLKCEYDFNILTQDEEVLVYTKKEHDLFFTDVYKIIEKASHKAHVEKGDSNNHFAIILNRRWAFQKFCLMLDIMIPLLLKYEASEPFYSETANNLIVKIEESINSELEIEDYQLPGNIFSHGIFLVDDKQN